MNYIKGFTYRLVASKNQTFAGDKAKESLRLLYESTQCDTIVLAIAALQDTPQSEQIDYVGDHMPTDEELVTMIDYAKSLGLRVILKPMLNCRNGVWRAHINFFDLEVVCEPKWSKWFESYNEYILHYAKIAQETACEMLIIGCELVQTERKEAYWRALIEKVRTVYQGVITYNTDKYQETEISWWDAVDVISSSGYYPINEWEQNLDRIEAVVGKFDKPFFFAECGCPCRKGSADIPNDWTFVGPKDEDEQARYYQAMFNACRKRKFVKGFACWDWVSNVYDYPFDNDGYSVYQKAACDVIKNEYKQ